MKKLSILLLAFTLVMFYGCEQNETEPTVSASEDAYTYTEDDYENVGKLHNIGLDKIINSNSFQARYAEFNSKNARTRTTEDTLNLMRYIQEQSINVIKEEGLLVGGKMINDVAYVYTDEGLMDMARNPWLFYITEAQEPYIKRIIAIVGKISKGNIDHQTAKQQIKEIASEAKKSLSAEEYTSIGMFAQIFSYSEEYWTNFRTNSRTICNAPSGQVYVSDAIGAYQGAIWGSVIPGFGTALMGFNGALIASSVS